MVVEAASALAVDDGGDVVGVGGIDAGEVGAAGEPPAALAVEVLDLAALPRRVRVAEPGVDVVGLDEGRPLRPFGALVERDRLAEVWRDSFEAVDETGEGVGVRGSRSAL